MRTTHRRFGVFTSESVGKGHPDKICDQIADSVLDNILRVSPDSRVACEVLASNRLILIGGEITTDRYADVVRCAWDVIKPLGYTENDFTIISNINSQSDEIRRLVDGSGAGLGAGDQGITIGYAVAETESLMPWGTWLAHELLRQAEAARVAKAIPDLRSDMKSQVTCEYSGNEVRIKRIIVSAQHAENANLPGFRRLMLERVVLPVLARAGFAKDLASLDRGVCAINPLGTFSVGGPIGDTGLTGRKLVADSYGPYARHGGGAYSGKDYTKVDRTGAYYARWIAKHVVALGWATECEARISWAIGDPRPLDVSIDCFGTNAIPLPEIARRVDATFAHSLSDIVQAFGMKEMSYLPYATYGHFGREGAPWERLTLYDRLKRP